MDNAREPGPSQGGGMTHVTNGRDFQLGQDLRITILTTGEETDGRHDLVEGVKQPGQTTPLHLHRRYEERIWVVSGELEVWAGDEHAVLRSGDFVHVPFNVPHALRAGADGCRSLNISSPAGFAELIERTGTPAELVTAETELDLDLFMPVAEELGDIVLGPPGTTPADLTPEQLAYALSLADEAP
jgi:quercetin dioxygenase-like cupin family protein